MTFKTVRVYLSKADPDVIYLFMYVFIECFRIHSAISYEAKPRSIDPTLLIKKCCNLSK